MGDIFKVIFQMSLTASAVILAVMLLRMLFARVPRKYSYLLWLIVLIRLVCPFQIRSDFGLIPDLSAWISMSRNEQLPEDAAPGAGINGSGQTSGAVYVPQKDDAAVISGEEDRELTEQAGENPEEQLGRAALHVKAAVSERIWNVIGWCWFTGMTLFAVFAGAGYLILMRRLKKYDTQTLKEISVGKKGIRSRAVTRISVRKRIRLLESEEVGSPFTVGVLRPMICLPSGLPEEQREMVLAHEHMHIRRKDHLVKILAAAVRCIHWFNPLVWAAFHLFEQDMETSCDEAALQNLGFERRKDYAKTLLSLSGRRSGMPALYPVSFGEKNTQARIRNILSLKKTKRRVLIISAAAVAAAALLLLTNREPVRASQENDLLLQTNPEEPADAGREGASDVQSENVPTGTVTPDGGIGESDGAAQEDKDRFNEMMAVKCREIMTRVSETICAGLLTEGDTHIEQSEHYRLYELIPAESGTQPSDSALPESDAQRAEIVTDKMQDGLLCNPLIEADDENSGSFTILYAYPIAGEEGKAPAVSAEYCSRVHPISGEVLFHSGCDFAAKEGTPVYAAAEGVVYRSGYGAQGGNYVILIHANGEVTYYAHCKEILPHIVPGAIVACGEQIATVGNTGMSTGPHLHFSVSRDGAYIEPKFAGTECDKF